MHSPHAIGSSYKNNLTLFLLLQEPTSGFRTRRKGLSDLPANSRHLQSKGVSSPKKNKKKRLKRTAIYSSGDGKFPFDENMSLLLTTVMTAVYTAFGRSSEEVAMTMGYAVAAPKGKKLEASKPTRGKTPFPSIILNQPTAVPKQAESMQSEPEDAQAKTIQPKPDTRELLAVEIHLVQSEQQTPLYDLRYQPGLYYCSRRSSDH